MSKTYNFPLSQYQLIKQTFLDSQEIYKPFVICAKAIEYLFFHLSHLIWYMSPVRTKSIMSYILASLLCKVRHIRGV